MTDVLPNLPDQQHADPHASTFPSSFHSEDDAATPAAGTTRKHSDAHAEEFHDAPEISEDTPQAADGQGDRPGDHPTGASAEAHSTAESSSSRGGRDDGHAVTGSDAHAHDDGAGPAAAGSSSTGSNTHESTDTHATTTAAADSSDADATTTAAAAAAASDSSSHSSTATTSATDVSDVSASATTTTTTANAVPADADATSTATTGPADAEAADSSTAAASDNSDSCAADSSTANAGSSTTNTDANANADSSTTDCDSSTANADSSTADTAGKADSSTAEGDSSTANAADNNAEAADKSSTTNQANADGLTPEATQESSAEKAKSESDTPAEPTKPTWTLDDENKPVGEMVFEERLAWGEKMKAEGNECFKKKDYMGALNAYGKGIYFLTFDAMQFQMELKEPQQEAILQLKLPLHSNTAMALLKVDEQMPVDHRMVVEHCNEVLRFKSNDPKARLRRGQANTKLGNLEEAGVDLREARRLMPKDPFVVQCLEAHKAAKKAEEEDLKKMWGGRINKQTEGLFSEAPTTPKSSKTWDLSLSPWTAGWVVASLAIAGMAYLRR